MQHTSSCSTWTEGSPNDAAAPRASGLHLQIDAFRDADANIGTLHGVGGELFPDVARDVRDASTSELPRGAVKVRPRPRRGTPFHMIAPCRRSEHLS